MKKILNNIGAISKQAIVGGVIGVATLMVGVGLINNFTGNSDSEQGFASNAIERSSYDGSYSGISAEDILSARNYAQDNREGSVSAITGTDRLALSRNSNAQNSTTGTANQAVEGMDDNSVGYGAGEIEGMGTSDKASISVSAEDAAAAKAQREAKIAKGKELGQTARAVLQTSKMPDSQAMQNIPGMQGASTSMTYGGTLGSSTGAGAGGAIDSSKVALAQAQFNKDLKANTGTLGAMGNSSREADGQRIGRAVNGQSYQTLGDLGRASKYSRSGKEAVVADAAQGAADAAAAFDGSKEAEAVSLDGTNLQQAAANALQDMGAPDMRADFDRMREDLEQIDANMEKWSRLMDQYAICIQSMILIASIAALGIAVATKCGPYGLIAAGVIWWVALAGLIASVIAANVILGQVADLAKQTGYTEAPRAWDWAAAWLVFGGLAGLMILDGFVPVGSTVGQFVISSLGALGGGNIISSIQKIIKLSKSVRASKEAEAVAGEIQNQTNNLNGNGDGNVLNQGKGRR